MLVLRPPRTDGGVHDDLFNFYHRPQFSSKKVREDLCSFAASLRIVYCSLSAVKDPGGKESWGRGC